MCAHVFYSIARGTQDDEAAAAAEEELINTYPPRILDWVDEDVQTAVATRYEGMLDGAVKEMNVSKLSYILSNEAPRMTLDDLTTLFHRDFQWVADADEIEKRAADREIKFHIFEDYRYGQ